MDQSKKSQSSAGAADEELFIREFEIIPRRQFILQNSVEDNLQTVKFMLENVNLDWEKRIEALRIFRCLLIDFTDPKLIDQKLTDQKSKDQQLIIASLKDLENCFQISLKDLRSKVVRETCITIAFTSVKLKNACEKFIETLLPLLFSLTQNSAKIMSTSAAVSIRFIIQNTHSSKFIPIVHQNLTSKSKDIRRFCCDFLNQLLRTWPKSILEKNIQLLQDNIKKGLNDADPEARSYSRKAFWMFDYYFKEKANQLYSTLDINKKRLLDNEKPADLNTINSLNNTTRSTKINKPNLQYPTKRLMKPKNLATGNLPILTPQRAVSSVDVEAIKRAEERNALFTPTTNQFTIKNSTTNLSNSSIKENNVNLDNIKTPINNQQQLRKPTSSIPRNKLLTIQQPQLNKSLTKITPLNRITRSQPASRSSSPSLRSAYLNDLLSPFSDASSNHSTNRLSGCKKSAIPIIAKRQSSNNCLDDFTNSPLMNRSLNKSINNQLNNSNRKIHLDYQSDASEVSSLCSDKSFSDRKLEDIDDIIKCLNSTHWPTKKDGLISLEHFIYQSATNLSDEQLKIITDLFTKMLLDPNTKTLSLLLSVFNSFILHYHHKLNFWLYILLTRLFLKSGSDILSSIQKRIDKTFHVILESFPKQDQFNVLIQFISDQKLTPVIKVKITSLEYLLKLILQMDPSDLNLNQNNYNRDEFEQFLMKIITWSEDKKSVQLTEICREIILELFNLNTPEFCNIVSQLPSGYWDTAYKYMKEKKVSSYNNNNNKNKVDDSEIFSQSFYDQILKFSFNNNKEELNQTAIFDSLMLKTTEEINRFTSNLTTDLNQTLNNKCKITDFNNHSVLKNQNTNEYKIDDIDDQSIYKTSEIENCEKKTNSMDSGISQLDCALSTNYKSNLSANKLSPESKEQLNNHNLNNIDNSSSSDLTTYNSFKSMNSFYVTTATSLKDQSLNNNDEDEDEEINEINNNYEKCLNDLENLNLKNQFNQDKFNQLINKIENDNQNLDDKLELLEELNYLILNSDNRKNLETNLNCIIELLIKQFDRKELILRQLIIKTFSDLLNTKLKDCFSDKQLELILNKLLFLTKQDYKELNTAIQHFTDILSTNFNINFFVDYLIKIIDNGQYPSNESSIKLITKFIKHSDEDTVNRLLPKIIPSIVKSNDNAITSVRKFSIFCLVELFNKVGIVIKSYLSSLDSSKIKLLKIYIDDSNSTRSSSPLLER